MHSSGIGIGGATGADELMARRPDSEPPEFDITAMVDLVFMMNIYFLVTFITVALGELNLPAASHVAPLDPDESVILTLTRSLDGNSVTLYIGDGAKGEAITDPVLQEQKVQAAVEQGIAQKKKKVLIKAEKKVSMGNYFRIATAATASIDGVSLTLHDAVMEKEK